MVDGDLESRIAGFFGAEPGVAAVWLFGSRASGRSRPTSDADLGILYEERMAPKDHVAWQRDVYARLSALGVVEPHPVLLDAADPVLCRQAIEKGRPILVRNRARAIDFRVRAWMDYLDLEPLRRMIISSRAAAHPGEASVG